MLSSSQKADPSPGPSWLSNILRLAKNLYQVQLPEHWRHRPQPGNRYRLVHAGPRGFLSGQPEMGNRVVIDKTGLKGDLQLRSERNPDRSSQTQWRFSKRSDKLPLPRPPGAARPEARAPKSPLEVLVINHVERPSEN